MGEHRLIEEIMIKTCEHYGTKWSAVILRIDKSDRTQLSSKEMIAALLCKYMSDTSASHYMNMPPKWCREQANDVPFVMSEDFRILSGQINKFILENAKR